MVSAVASAPSNAAVMLHRFPSSSAAFMFCPKGSSRFRDWTPLALSLLPLGLVLDIGAHDGSDALIYARAGHNVMSFEPNPSKREAVVKRINASGFSSQITFVSAAVADEVGTQRFWSADTGGEMDSLSKPIWGDETKLHPLTVPVTTIDAVVGQQIVAFAKIDTQGHGAREHLEQQSVTAAYASTVSADACQS